MGSHTWGSWKGKDVYAVLQHLWVPFSFQNNIFNLKSSRFMFEGKKKNKQTNRTCVFEKAFKQYIAKCAFVSLKTMTKGQSSPTTG